MAEDTAFGEVRLFDDFLGTTYDQYMWAENHGDGTANISEIENGVFLFDNDGTDGDKINLMGAAIWQPSVQGTIVFEARVRLVTSILQGVFIGLSDEVTNETPADIDGGTTLATDADDVVGFVYESDKGSDWYVITSKAQADGALTDTTIGPTKDVYQTFRIVVETNGDCRFFIDGDEITASGAARKAAITTSVQFCPAIAQLANNTAADVHVDYVLMKAGRA